jgi:hypothetical protein
MMTRTKRRRRRAVKGRRRGSRGAAVGEQGLATQMGRGRQRISNWMTRMLQSYLMVSARSGYMDLVKHGMFAEGF